jgi:D-alanyl-D-alanine carboxypeptidase (penicillin-binding protein 5/6)/beta-lactamase class A
VIAHAPPPAPVVAAPAVSFGHVAARVGAGTERLEVQADGRITARLRPAPGPRRVSVPVPTGVHAVRVKAVGRGGARWSATVRVRALPASALRAGRVPGFVDPALQRDVERLAAGTSATTGVYVQHLITGCGAAANADGQFPAASTLKAAILVDAVRHGQAGALRSTLDRMIIDSDDAAANSVLAALGGGSGDAGAAEVTDTLRDLGLERSLVRRPYIIEEAGRRPLPIEATASPPLYTNFISTPYELARLMVAVHRGAVGRGGVRRLGIGVAEARSELLARLLDVRDRTKLVAGLPAAVPVAHKTGYTDDVRHDAGIIYLRSGPVVAAAMTYRAGSIGGTGEAFIASVARAARARLAGGGACHGLPLRPRRARA